MDPNKRGNPPFEPSSYAAGMERRIERHNRWRAEAMKAARLLLDGTAEDKRLGAEWWREQFDPPNVVLSAPPR